MLFKFVSFFVHRVMTETRQKNAMVLMSKNSLFHHNFSQRPNLASQTKIALQASKQKMIRKSPSPIFFFKNDDQYEKTRSATQSPAITMNKVSLALFPPSPPRPTSHEHNFYTEALRKQHWREHKKAAL